MANDLIPLSQSLVNIREQIKSLGGELYALNPAGRELMPLKAQMLYGLPLQDAADAYEAVALLFSASMKYVDAQQKERRAERQGNTVNVVKARIAKGLAEGATVSLCSGKAKHLLLLAITQAPIPMNAICGIAPDLWIKSRLSIGNTMTARNAARLERRLRLQRLINR